MSPQRDWQGGEPGLHDWKPGMLQEALTKAASVPPSYLDPSRGFSPPLLSDYTRSEREAVYDDLRRRDDQVRGFAPMMGEPKVSDKLRTYYLTDVIVRHTLDAGGDAEDCVVNLCAEVAAMRDRLVKMLDLVPRRYEILGGSTFEDLVRAKLTEGAQ